MSESGGRSSFVYFLAGCVLGALAALLFAPQTGEKTRKLIGRAAGDSKDYVSSKGKEMRRAAGDFVDRGRRTAEDLVEKGKDIVSKT